MTRILWHSVAPWAASGYGNQTGVFTPRLRDQGHDIAISAYWGLGGSMLTWEGMDIYPQDGDFGSRLLPTYAAMHDAELVITLMDVWPLKPQELKGIRNLASWVPVDHEPVGGKTVKFFEITGSRPIAMSRFGERLLRDAGLDPLYVPHGIDTKVLQPMREVRKDLRDIWEMPRDAFVVGMVAANKGRTPSRKAFPEVMQAFAEFRRRHPNAYLYLHTDPSEHDMGVPLGRLIQRTGVPLEALRGTGRERVEMGLPATHMAAMYSAFDVLANPAYGEGFGIPIVESQACGCPVIVTDFSAMTELCGAGWLVGADPWYDAQHGTFYGRPRPIGERSILEAFEHAYKARHDRELRERAREFALRYDADVVAETYWKRALEHLAPTPVVAKPWTPSSRIVLPGGVR